MGICTISEKCIDLSGVPQGIGQTIGFLLTNNRNSASCITENDNKTGLVFFFDKMQPLNTWNVILFHVLYIEFNKNIKILSCKIKEKVFYQLSII